MKKSLAIAALIFVLAASESFAGGTTTAGATVNLNVLSAFTVTQVRGLIQFGNVYQGNSATVDPAAGGANAAAWSIAGSNGVSLTITYPASLTITNGTDNITVTPTVSGNTVNTQASSSPITSGNSVTTAASGTPVYYLWAGGSATVPPSASSGAYTGNLTITITY